ncbi:SHOCT domain-containing protein [Halorussus halobius]|uniref:SHOCT domain-containing protein n=1 Tax=Halorussus halobius TaxID=1710537 RepID=UPI001091D492|nr:SHOCT domain-containing protein [Halorussus halobius]
MADESTEADDLVGALTAVVAVATLPVGTLALLFASVEVAIVVFVVGWFLLTPLVPIVGEELLPALGGSSDGGDSSAEPADPLAELRSRYARAEIGDAEFERQVEKLLATEEIEVDPDAVFDAGATPNVDSGVDAGANSDAETPANRDAEYDRE